MKCDTCKFYDEPNGECHFNAPKPARSTEEARWPGVNQEDWCGRYKEADAPRPDDYRGKYDDAIRGKYDDAIRLGTELWMAAHAVRDADTNTDGKFEELRKVLKKTESTFDEIPF